MSADIDFIKEMGFSENKAKKALKATGNKGLQTAIDWLVDNADKISDNELAEEEDLDEGAVAKSFKCDDCGKMLRSDKEIEIHSAKTGHTNFSESTEEIKPLTEEEKEDQRRRVQEFMKKRQDDRVKEERAEEIEKEKRRRAQGRDIGDAKEKFERDEMLRAIAEKKRQKEEDQLYKEKLKADMARERAEKLAKQRGEKVESAAANPAPVKVEPPKQVVTDQCRLQIRYPSGKPLAEQFDSKEKLEKVLAYVFEHWPNSDSMFAREDIVMSTTYPKKDFTPEQYSCTLQELNLCPASALMVKLKTDRRF